MIIYCKNKLPPRKPSSSGRDLHNFYYRSQFWQTIANQRWLFWIFLLWFQNPVGNFENDKNQVSSIQLLLSISILPRAMPTGGVSQVMDGTRCPGSQRLSAARLINGTTLTTVICNQFEIYIQFSNTSKQSSTHCRKGVVHGFQILNCMALA